MAINMKTIKFGENGEVYAVNAYPVQVSGELTEAASQIDFGSFDGLTELHFIIDNRGAADASNAAGSYGHVIINGTQSTFFTCSISTAKIFGGTLKKINGIWSVLLYSESGHNSNACERANELMNSLSPESVTSFAAKAYGANVFGAGTKYALEGR